MAAAVGAVGKTRRLQLAAVVAVVATALAGRRVGPRAERADCQLLAVLAWMCKGYRGRLAVALHISGGLAEEAEEAAQMRLLQPRQAAAALYSVVVAAEPAAARVTFRQSFHLQRVAGLHPA